MTYTTLNTTTDNAIMTVTLDNGEVNMMSAIMVGELFALVGELTVNPAVKVVVFESANPDFFIAHFDLNDILKAVAGDPSVPASKYPDINILQSLGLSIQALPQVTIAKVDGICRGGGVELILAMDMVFSSEGARYALPEASVGFLPSGGGATLMPTKVGRGRALEFMLTGRDFDGREAERYGLVNNTLEDGDSLDAYVNSTAASIAANRTDAIKAVKATVKKPFEALNAGVLSGLAQENASMLECLSSPEVFEGLQALAEKSGTRESEIDLVKTIREMQ
jgi:enoyl-CoA hydratase/carnithine racemase